MAEDLIGRSVLAVFSDVLECLLRAMYGTSINMCVVCPILLNAVYSEI